ncbi:serine/threonine-protein kinase [Streptomyces sp. KHY 26]|uniref:serine/threonine-protein kinase n=1 Tax=Streptomyces sp. KHY 26 TaxID=3097359 RepID=UPI00376F20A1
MSVLLSLDGPHLVDFGIARALDGGATALTGSGHVMGSPGYMSTEQAAGKRVGPQSDVFSLGAVLAAAATGRNPFGEGTSAAVVIYRILYERPDLDGLPDALRDIVTACLDKDPDRRPTPEQVRERLLPDLDATVRHGSWLPPALAESVARLATGLLRLDAPAATAPPLTRIAPPPYPPAAAAPVRGRRPRRRSMTVLATFVTTVVTAAAAWAVWSGGVLGNATHAPDGTAASGPTGTASGTATEPDTVSPASEVPDAFVGTWATGDGTGTPLVTLTIRQGRIGAVVGTASVSHAADGCRVAVRLTAVETTRIALVGAGPVHDIGAGDCADPSAPPDGGQPAVLTLLSGSTLRMGSGEQAVRLTRRS